MIKSLAGALDFVKIYVNLFLAVKPNYGVHTQKAEVLFLSRQR